MDNDDRKCPSTAIYRTTRLLAVLAVGTAIIVAVYTSLSLAAYPMLLPIPIAVGLFVGLASGITCACGARFAAIIRLEQRANMDEIMRRLDHRDARIYAVLTRIQRSHTPTTMTDGLDAEIVDIGERISRRITDSQG